MDEMAEIYRHVPAKSAEEALENFRRANLRLVKLLLSETPTIVDIHTGRSVVDFFGQVLDHAREVQANKAS